MRECPKCGSLDGYSVKVRAFGYVMHEGSWRVAGGDERVVDDSALRWVADKTVKCLNCGKRTLMKLLRAA